MSETRAGGLELDKLELNVGHAVLDIRPLFTSFNFYEDIFSNYVTATLTLDDSMNLPTNEQIVGHEEFHIKFKGNDPYGAPGTNADWIDLKLLVHGMTDRLVTGEKTQQYVLNMTSHAALLNNLKKVSKSYNAPIPNIITNIGEEYLDCSTFNSVNSTSTFCCVIPYWSPTLAINWLAERCVHASAKGGLTADCLVYQDRDGFVIASLSELKGQKPVVLDAGGSTIYHQVVGVGDPKRETLQRTAETVTIQPSFNTLSLAQEGAYATQVVSHDIIRKKVTHHPAFNYQIDFSSRPNLEQNDFIGNKHIYLSSRDEAGPNVPGDAPKPIGKLTDHKYAGYRFQSKHAYQFDKGPIHVQQPERWVAQRLSQLNMMENLKVAILMPGDTTIKLGTVVRWKDFPTQEPSQEGIVEVKDELLSGDFLVTAIHHALEQGMYKMIVELTKDSLAKGLT